MAASDPSLMCSLVRGGIQEEGFLSPQLSGPCGAPQPGQEWERFRRRSLRSFLLQPPQLDCGVVLLGHDCCEGRALGSVHHYLVGAAAKEGLRGLCSCSSPGQITPHCSCWLQISRGWSRGKGTGSGPLLPDLPPPLPQRIQPASCGGPLWWRALFPPPPATSDICQLAGGGDGEWGCSGSLLGGTRGASSGQDRQAVSPHPPHQAMNFCSFGSCSKIVF